MIVNLYRTVKRTCTVTARGVCMTAIGYDAYGKVLVHMSTIFEIWSDMNIKWGFIWHMLLTQNMYAYMVVSHLKENETLIRFR